MEGIRVTHALPGRVRLKVARFKGDPELARRAGEKLAKVPGIKQVQANPLTGSLLILHDLVEPLAAETLEPLGEFFEEFFPGIEALDLISSLEGLADIPAPEASGGGLLGAMSALNAGVARLTGGLDLKVLAPLALFLWGLRGLLAGEKKAAPAWRNYFWMAGSVLLLLNRGGFDSEQREAVSTPVTGETKEAG